MSQTDAMREAIAGRLVGHRVARVEDPRLLTGRGRYVDDVTVPGMLHAHFVRSPVAHAVIRGVDVEAARAHPGVAAVYTGADMQSLTHPFMGLLPLPGLYHPLFYALAVDRVRVVGDPVALIVAESRYVAEDAAQLVEVDYEDLAPIATIEHALDPTRPAIWPGPGGNVLQEDHTALRRRRRRVRGRRPGGARAVRAAPLLQPADGDTRVRGRGRPRRRHGAVPRRHAEHPSHEVVAGRAHRATNGLAVGGRDRPPARAHDRPAGEGEGDGRGEQGRRRGRSPRRSRSPSAKACPPRPRPGKAMAQTFLREPVRLLHLARIVLGLLARDPVTLPRVTAQDVGGAFGVKVLPTREDVAVLAAAVDLGRSVKWIEDRNEHLLIAGQAREETLDVEAALRDDGTLLGMRVHIKMDQGAYPAFPFSAAMYPLMIRTMMPGPYRLPALGFRTTLTASNKATYVAYRGPWAVETWVRERVLDIAAARARASAATRSGCATSSGPTSCPAGC